MSSHRNSDIIISQKKKKVKFFVLFSCTFFYFPEIARPWIGERKSVGRNAWYPDIFSARVDVEIPYIKMKKKKFATSINCIDGRVQNPVSEWMKKHLNVDYVDMITEPGPDKKLTQGPAEVIESLRQKVMISVKVHNTSTVAVSAHYNCAGNPISKEEHLKQIKKSVKVIKGWGLPVRILGLWINKQRKVEIIEDVDEV